MQKRLLLPLCCLIGMLLILNACRKEISTPAATEEILSTPLPGQTTYCRIESFWENPHAPNQRFLLVLYDEFENPTHVTIPLPTTGNPYRSFKYDQWHRLREYIGTYGNDAFEFWHFYGFDNKGRIGVDTNYILGTVAEKPTVYHERRISQIEYDNQGRIVKVTTNSTITGTSVGTYSYDAAGNLIYPPSSGIVYDNKMNLNRTNDIWQFLNRDYSMNNPFMADEYNSTGFPTVINTDSPQYMFWLDEVDLHHCQISYSCRPANW